MKKRKILTWTLIVTIIGGLLFIQYVKSGRRDYWEARKEFLAVLAEEEAPTGPDLSAPEMESSAPVKGDTKRIDLGRDSVLKLVYIPPGIFTMGSPSDEEGRSENEGPLTEVTLTEGFWMGETEVTQGQWEAVMDFNPAEIHGYEKYAARPDLPVCFVDWVDARWFCHELSEMTGMRIMLPTEAQWEYACRAGSTSRWSFGDHESLAYDYGWYEDNSSRLHPVAKKKENGFGLYDMHGSVSEWCEDWYERRLPGGKVTDPTGPSHGEYRVYRGGAWCHGPLSMRSAQRVYDDPDTLPSRGSDRGFRVVAWK